MKRLFIALLLISQIGCHEPVILEIAPPVPEDPTVIDGLELEFQRIETASYYTAIMFTNESTGFIATTEGAIIKTTDGGESWTNLITDHYVPLKDLSFINDQEGWAAGGASDCNTSDCTPRGAVLLHTTDGGATWTEVRLDLSKRIALTSVWFVNSDLGFITSDRLIARTTDGGETWEETVFDFEPSIGINPMLVDIKFVDAQHGIATASAGRIVRTEDGGDTWTVTTPFGDASTIAAAYASTNIVYTGTAENLYRSADYGKTWNSVAQLSFPIHSMTFASDNAAFIFGMGDYQGGDIPRAFGSIFYTADGGQTWKGTSEVHEASMIISSSFPSERTGYAISNERFVKITLK